MTLTADLTVVAPPVGSPGEPGCKEPQAAVRTPAPSAGVVRRSDLVRLAVTLATAGAVLSGLGALSADGRAGDGASVLRTPYGLIAVGRASVETSSPVETRNGAPGAAVARVVVPVTLHNLSDEPVHYGPEHFRLRTGTATLPPEAGSVRSGDVSPGGAVQLRLVFPRGGAGQPRLTVDVAKPAAGLQLHLPPSAAAPAS